jgi:hypothetical protein
MKRRFRMLADGIGGEGHKVLMAAFGRIRQDKVGLPREY